MRRRSPPSRGKRPRAQQRGVYPEFTEGLAGRPPARGDGDAAGFGTDKSNPSALEAFGTEGVRVHVLALELPQLSDWRGSAREP